MSEEFSPQQDWMYTTGLLRFVLRKQVENLANNNNVVPTEPVLVDPPEEDEEDIEGYIVDNESLKALAEAVHAAIEADITAHHYKKRIESAGYFDEDEADA